jgi:hypothetical protein
MEIETDKCEGPYCYHEMCGNCPALFHDMNQVLNSVEYCFNHGMIQQHQQGAVGRAIRRVHDQCVYTHGGTATRDASPVQAQPTLTNGDASHNDETDKVADTR